MPTPDEYYKAGVMVRELWITLQDYVAVTSVCVKVEQSDDDPGVIRVTVGSDKVATPPWVSNYYEVRFGGDGKDSVRVTPVSWWGLKKVTVADNPIFPAVAPS